MDNTLTQFDFHVEGNGAPSLKCAPVMAENEDKAFKEALKQVKRLKLPGWRLVCDTTGTSMPATEFVEYDALGRPIAKARL